MPSDLGQMQARFRDSVLGSDDAGIAPSIDTATTGRIAIYRHTVQASLMKVIAMVFPVTERVIGKAAFAKLSHTFVVSAPPRVPQLSVYGAGFPAFIAAAEVVQHLPYLADVARLEWARGEAYFAAASPALDPATLTRLSPEEMERTRLRLHPAVRLVRSAFPIQRIWQVNQPAVVAVPRVDMEMAENVLISRPRHKVLARVVEPGDAVFVAQLQAGAMLGAAATAALEASETFDLQAALAQHFVNGTFAG